MSSVQSSDWCARNQTIFLLKLFLWLKRFKCFWIMVMVISTLSNHVIFILVEKYMGEFGRTQTHISASEFFWNSVIMVDVMKAPLPFVTLTKIIVEMDIERSLQKSFFDRCSFTGDCSLALFKALYGRAFSNKYTTFVDYGMENDTPSITCQVAYGADLHCPFFGHLVASSKNSKLRMSLHTFSGAEFFSLTARSERSTAFRTREHNSVCAKRDNFDLVLSRTVIIQAALLIFAVFFYFLVSTVSCIVDLKKNGFLKIMFRKGLSVRSYWLAIWCITSVEILLIAALFTLSLALQCVGFYSATSVLAVLFATIVQLFGIAAVVFLLTVVLNKYFHIGITIVLIAICVCALTPVMRLRFPEIAKILLVFLIPLGHHGEFTQAYLLTVILPDSVGVYHHLVLLVGFMFAAMVVALTLYLDYVLSTGNGFCLHWSFIMDNRFWNFSPSEEVSSDQDPLASESLPDMANVEPVMDGLQPIIRISHLGKKYIKSSCLFTERRTTVALSDVTAHIYRNQITAIVGHSGSGKTTLLNILNGTELPTSGQASVSGLTLDDPISRMKLYRASDVCLENNSLCTALSVIQTLEMVLISCNTGLEDGKEKINNVLNSMQMKHCQDLKISMISTGAMRKLCTAIALIGDSKVLFLDEPTSGVDPLSRRRIWKLLQEHKKRCSIVISTQSMDEADTLADRKIFLSGGAMICAGSSLFLRSTFDCGFDFNVTLKSAAHAPLLIRQIQQDFKAAIVRNRFGSSVDFHLPAADINMLPAFAQALERRGEWIAAFGLLQASLYDIFMRLRDLRPEEVENLFEEGRIGLVLADEEEKAESLPRVSKLGQIYGEKQRIASPSVFRTFRSMVYLNVIRVLRSRVKLGSRIGTPAVLLLALIIMACVEKMQNNASLSLTHNLTNFGESFTRGVCVFYADKTSLDNRQCASIFQNASSADVNNYLALPIKTEMQLYDFLQVPDEIEKIKAVCRSATVSQVECPIVYTTDWKTSVTNSERQVSIGSFSTFDQFNSSLAASVTIGGYYKLAKYFLLQHIPDESRIPPGDYKFTTKSIYNFRGKFIPLFGVFLQLIIISIIPATFLDDLMEDKETKVRTQLSSMGMSMFSYWITMHFVHWIQYAAIYLLSVILIVSINPTGYASSFYLAGIVLPTLIFGLSNNQLTVYILSSLLNKSNPVVTVTYFFFSIILVVIILLVQLDNIAGVVLIALVPPIASIALTFYGTKAIFYTLSYFKTEGSALAFENLKLVYFFQPHILGSFASIFVHALLLPIVLCAVERKNIFTYLIQILNRNTECNEKELHYDTGVIEEVERLDEMPRNPENLLETRHLRMTFPGGAKVLRGVTFATIPGEILGLLGPNGAGKSTTMAIMVGDLRATGGRCEVRCGGNWHSSGLAARKGFIGYCPQYNPLYDDVTTREHLEFYACILGVAPSDAKREIDILIASLELEPHENKKSSELSFGFKRRLSMAAALLGDPCLLVIDEASTGVDPEGKRILWGSIRALANEKRCIIISTHSMEEAEALCNRVCVMNYGLLAGLGSVQLLKSRYGQSSTLEIIIKTDSNEPAESLDAKRAAVAKAVGNKFSGSSMVEEFANRVTFSIPLSSCGRLSLALSWLAEVKQTYDILYFSFFQMSLDQVFARMINLHNRELFENRHDLGTTAVLYLPRQSAGASVVSGATGEV